MRWLFRDVSHRVVRGGRRNHLDPILVDSGHFFELGGGRGGKWNGRGGKRKVLLDPRHAVPHVLGLEVQKVRQRVQVVSGRDEEQRGGGHHARQKVQAVGVQKRHVQQVARDVEHVGALHIPRVIRVLELLDVEVVAVVVDVARRRRQSHRVLVQSQTLHRHEQPRHGRRGVQLPLEGLEHRLLFRHDLILGRVDRMGFLGLFLGSRRRRSLSRRGLVHDFAAFPLHGLQDLLD
ncbi:hypothetical protein H257_17192 [Aphanomyces astaci]|uniref:Uncharacterized protein n=1 Tax=Aphanomyces astaci TaxID=112090 RepID=W4FG52_APHAT|nr:hypothetical protein H257_17192 [Aphanomyces astaci]ETV66420.1 hypothetical protein H257_17192 [Aphanomyces astaci]|eukprot:XP_009844195.1 hypothetical protein H257_17192 [Aphanomyces astaci]